MKLNSIQRPNIKRGTLNYYMERMGGYFDKLEVFSTAGDIRPPCLFQWVAYSIALGDDVCEGIGETPEAAIENLYNELVKL